MGRFIAFSRFVWLSVACMLGSCTPVPRSAVDPAAETAPNILLILADDLGWSDLGAFGSEIPTPALDQLANAGLMLTNFHASPTCSPSRAMLLTGQDHHRVGLGSMAELLTDNQRGQPGYEGHLQTGVVTLAGRLASLGYHTYMAGKWHLGSEPGQWPADRGFERSFALLEAGASHFTEQGLSPMAPIANYVRDGERAALEKGFFSTDAFTDELITYIGRQAGDGKPFFAYAAFTAPHYPLHAPEEWIARFEGHYDKGWDALRMERRERQIQLGLVPNAEELLERDPQVPAWSALTAPTRAAQARRMEVYAAMVANLDWNVGRLLSWLARAGLQNNTVVIFLSDNGAEAVDFTMMPAFSSWFEEHFDLRTKRIGHAGSYAFQGPGWAQVSNTPWRNFKGLTTEGGTRVPAIIHDPRKAVATRSDALTSILDLFPTVLELAGAGMDRAEIGEEASQFRGHSLLPLLSDASLPVRAAEESFAMELMGHRAIRRQGWKALSFRAPWGDGEWSLYDLSTDPLESRPVQDDHPAVLNELRAAYQRFADEVGVIVPQSESPMRYPMLPPIDSWPTQQGNGPE